MTALVKSNHRMTTRQSVLAFVGDRVMPAPGVRSAHAASTQHTENMPTVLASA